jgi:MATE family, multidrug efflux pump
MSLDNPSQSPTPLNQHRPLVELLLLAGPTIAQMASYTVMQFIDTYLLSRLGSLEPTAVGNAGIIAFSFVSFGFGMLMLVNTLVSQKYGRGDFHGAGQSLWQGIWAALAYSALLLPALPFVSRTFEWFGHAPDLARLERQYMQIVLCMVCFKLIGTAFSQFLLGTNRPNAVLVAAVIGVACNMVAALPLVLGWWGVTSRGVAGAAWAQNVGVFVEMIVLIAFAMGSPRLRQKFNVTDWRFRAPEMRVLIEKGSASGLQVVADVLAWGLFGNVVIGELGQTAMTANNFMFRYMVVSFMPAFGISQAVTALVGRYIGRGRPDLARQRAHVGFQVASIYMVLCGVAYIAGGRWLIGCFTTDPEVLRLGVILMVFAGIYQVFDAMYIIYNGALRGAGDTFVPAIATAGLNWSITVAGGWLIAHYHPQWGVTGPWVAALIYGITLGIFMFVRFVQGNWEAIHLEPDSNRVEDSVTLPGFQLTADK